MREEDYENQYIKQWKLDSVAMVSGVSVSQ